jgi:hypothetical protein
MLPPVTVPAGLLSVLEVVRGAFTAPGFATFVALVTGYLGATGRRTVTGMWIAAGLAGIAHHARAHRFFSHTRWDADTVGLLLARAVVRLLVPASAAVEVVVDDTLFHRYGRRVFGAYWQHDGSARGRDGLGRGNCFVIAGIVVTVTGMGRPVFLPLLFRLYQPKTSPSKPELARQMAGLLARTVHPRRVHVTGDTAYRSPAWRGLPPAITFTTRLLPNAVLYAPPPPRTRRPGRPNVKGHRLGTPAELAATATWQQATITRYGTTTTVELAVIDGRWYGSLRATPVTVILVRDPDRNNAYDIALITTDTTAAAEQIVRRYAARWSIEQSIKDGKDLFGTGDAQNRLENAVQRSVPFALLCQTILVLWYTRTGDTNHDITTHRTTAPWYRNKTTISLDDMLIAFRRARITAAATPHAPSSKNTDEPLTSHSAAA